MKDVAAVAGVSLATVSRVVNESHAVRPDLAVRVHDAIAVLGYRRDLTARTLRRADRLSASIGVIVEDVANPFFAALSRGIEDVARTRDVLAFVGSSDEDLHRERELAEGLAARGVDGLIIAPCGGDHSYLLRDRNAGTALVFVDRPPGFIDADTALADNVGGAADVVSHLVAAGHRRIAFLGDRADVFTAAQRLRGYREGLARHGLAEDAELIQSLSLPAEAYGATRALLERQPAPTALFTSQNLITIEAVRAMHEMGRQHTVALVGFDDVVLADVLEPGLTVVSQDPAALGRAAAELLFSRLDGYDGPSRRLVLETTLVERGSGELAPGAPS
jgi:LacI family transcriptional regulator